MVRKYAENVGKLGTGRKEKGVLFNIVIDLSKANKPTAYIHQTKEGREKGLKLRDRA